MTPPSNPRGTLATLAGFLAIAGPATPAAGSLPREPIAIGREPQYLFDLHVVDNHWALKYADEGIRRVSHQAKKHPGNPVIPTGEHFKISNVWVVRDEPGGVYRMWYQNNLNVAAVGQTEVADPNEVIEEERGRRGGGAFRKYVGYAESKDGIRWEKPHLDFFPDWPGRKLGEPNNCALETGASQAGGASVLIDIPEKDRRGYRHVMLYRRQGGRGAAGIYLVG